MGRHGGGSRSGGGGGSSRSGGGSRSGGSSSRNSTKYFEGSYNRSYCTRSGKKVSYYTSDKYFGTRKPNLLKTIVFANIPYLIAFVVLCLQGLTFGSKANGDINRIYIDDQIDLLTVDEEREVIKLFNDVYEESGMPITLVTMDISYQKYYSKIEALSEELYYSISSDEDACLILFLADTSKEHVLGWYDWKYDVYCGDDTYSCFSDKLFDKFLDKFQTSLSQKNLYKALDAAWKSVMYDMAGIEFEPVVLIFFCIILVMHGIPTNIICILGYIKNRDAYEYFQEYPGALTGVNKKIKKTCPSCGAMNTESKDTCAYCGTILTNVIGKIEFT